MSIETALPERFNPYQSTLWIGHAGTGKTVALRAVVDMWEGPVYVIAAHQGEWHGYSADPHVNWLAVQGKDSAVTMLETTLALIQARAATDRFADASMARLLVIVDDLRHLTYEDNYAAELIGRVLVEGRTLGVHVHATTQRLTVSESFAFGSRKCFAQILETRAPHRPFSLTDHPESEALLNAATAYGTLRDALGGHWPEPPAQALPWHCEGMTGSGKSVATYILTQRATEPHPRPSIRGALGRVLTLRTRDGGG